MTETPAADPEPTPPPPADTTTPPTPPDPGTPPRVSFTISAMLILGMLITVLGVVFLALGLGGSTVLDLTIGDNEFKTTSVAIVITAVGLVLSLGPLKFLPDGTTIFSAMGGPFTAR